MANDIVYTQFRASDAEQRSYSLRERLIAGKLLFTSDPQAYRKMDTPVQIFWNAVHVVFDNRIFKASFLKQTPLEAVLASTPQEKQKKISKAAYHENYIKEFNERTKAYNAYRAQYQALSENERYNRADEFTQATTAYQTYKSNYEDYLRRKQETEGKIEEDKKERMQIYAQEKAKENSALNNFMTAGYWNPFAWLEALSLFWVNWATARYQPLTDSGLSTFGSYCHISFAALVHAFFKTVNLVCTPLAVILLGSAAFAFGFTPAVITFTVFAIAASIFSVIYHRDRSKKLFADIGQHASPYFHWMQGIRHFFSSLIMGIIQPLVRLAERARDLYHTHPKLFWAGVFVVTIAVFAFAVFPYVGAPAILGFKLGSVALKVFSPVLTKLAEYFVLNAVEATVFKSAVTFVTVLGVVDLISRGFKEIAGWFDSFQAKKATLGQSKAKSSAGKQAFEGQYSAQPKLNEEYIKQGDLALIQIKDKTPPSPDKPYQACFFQYKLAPDDKKTATIQTIITPQQKSI